MSVAAAIERNPTPGLKLIRRSPGSVLVRGQWRESSTTKTDLLGMAQPIDNKTKVAMQLQRTDAGIFVYTLIELYTNDVSLKRAADVVEYRDVHYEVQGVEDWWLHGGYFRSTCVRVDQ